MYMDTFNLILQDLEELFEKHGIEPGHGIRHSKLVLGHTRRAMEYVDLKSYQIQALELAAIGHDSYDRKFFPDSSPDTYISIMKKRGVSNKVIDLVIEIIDLVSFTKNGNTLHEPSWMLLVRWSDRLEGQVIERCTGYNHFTGNPEHSPNTPMILTLEELDVFISGEEGHKLLEEYMRVKKTDSVLDHFLQKLFYIAIKTGIPYFDDEMVRRDKVLREYYITRCRDIYKAH